MLWSEDAIRCDTLDFFLRVSHMRIYMLAAVSALKFPMAEDDSVAGV